MYSGMLNSIGNYYMLNIKQHWFNCIPRMSASWWFQTFFIFTPIWGRFPFWRAYFSDGWFNHQPVSVWFFFRQDSLAALSLFQVTRGSFRKVCPGWGRQQASQKKPKNDLTNLYGMKPHSLRLWTNRDSFHNWRCRGIVWGCVAIFLDIDHVVGVGEMIFGVFGPWDAGSFLEFLRLELSFLNASVTASILGWLLFMKAFFSMVHVWHRDRIWQIWIKSQLTTWREGIVILPNGKSWFQCWQWGYDHLDRIDGGQVTLLGK